MAVHTRILRLSPLLLALALAGCNSNEDDGSAGMPSGSTAPAAPTFKLTVTPSLGKVSGARVILRNARTHGIIDNQKLDTDGRARFRVPQTVDSVLVELQGQDDSRYFDEAKGDRALPRDFSMRAASPISGNLNLGVTLLTEAAVQYAESLPAALTNPDNIEEAARKIGEAVGVDNINQPPALIASPDDIGRLGDSPGDRYALQLAGLVQAATERTGSDTPALELARNLSRDLSDGQMDGRDGETLLTGIPYSPLPSVFAESWKFGMELMLENVPEGSLKDTLRADVVDATEVKDTVTSPVVTDDTDFGGNAGKWKGEIFLLPENSGALPDFSTMTPIGSLYTDEIDITQRAFTEPFPGVPSDRYEWFAVRYQGPLTVRESGQYTFQTNSDDGSKLYIDDVLVVNHDGTHGAYDSAAVTVDLARGVHTLRIEYFQGPRWEIALRVFGNKAGEARALLHPVL